MKKIVLGKEQVEQIYNDYYQGMSLTALEKKYGIERHKLSRNLKEQGYEITKRKHPVNEAFFDEIDTEEKAYWLGFLAADGCNDDHRRTILINLNERDIDHLKKFRTAINSDAEITSVAGAGYGEGTTLSRITIYSARLCDALTKHQVPPRKSNILQPPNINPAFYKHWIRGYLDGDGSVYISNDCAYLAFVGTKEVLNFIINYFKPGEQHALYARHPELNKNNFQFSFGGNVSVIRYLHQIYDGATVYLERKYQKVLEIYGRFEK